MRGRLCASTSRFAALALGALAVWGLGTVGKVQADDITVAASASVGPARSSDLGTGLDGVYYYNGLAPVINDTTTVADFRASIAAANPGQQATFKGLRLNWAGGDTAAVNTYMGADAASLTPNITHATNTSYWDMTGYINIPGPGKYTFHTNSDDASFVLIAGMQVVNNGTTHGGQDRSGTATFSAAGLYPIEILYSNQDFFNNGMVSQGSGALEYDSTVPGDAGTGNHTALYSQGTVPEASGLTLAGLGIAGLLGYALRRRKLAA
jgi:PA14 domain